MRTSFRLSGLVSAAFFFYSSAAFASPVTAWVPSYSVSACKTMLQKDFGGVSMGDGLTFLPMQTYVPTSARDRLDKRHE